MQNRFVILIGLFLIAALTGGPTLAQDLPRPTGPVLLTVAGDLSVTNAGDVALFDRDMLLALGTRKIVTTTIWTDGPQTFVGVPLKAVADRLGITDRAFRAYAINEYVVEIPLSDITQDAALLALQRNGAEMSVRQKGPIWLVYPFDADPRFRAQAYYSRSIWQLIRLETSP